MILAGCLGMSDVDQMALGSDLRCVYWSKNAVMSWYMGTLNMLIMSCGGRVVGWQIFSRMCMSSP